MGKTIRLMNTRFTLLPEKALLIPEYDTLVVADWHLGKGAHFRKSGIFMPVLPADKHAAGLQLLLDIYRPKTIVFLGDLFHSDLNSEWMVFERFRIANPLVRIILTRGNHDILPDELLKKAAVDVVSAHSVAPHIRCRHHPDWDEFGEEQLTIAGHVHPGCAIHMKGRQRYRLPCFYYHNKTLLLPAFGALTGLHMVQRLRGARIYPVAGDKVWEFPTI